jgi:diguanylate cyclase (GGDEF)-like protein
MLDLQVFTPKGKIIAQMWQQIRILREENAALKQQVFIDPITGLGNRARYNADLDLLWRLADRKQETIALLFIDLDNLKLINDVKAVSSIIKSRCRASDSVSRLGGDEMSAILPGADIEGAIAVAEDIRKLVEAAGYTVSIGVASLVPDNVMNQENLYKMADTALYAAKAQGRNKVCA